MKKLIISMLIVSSSFIGRSQVQIGICNTGSVQAYTPLLMVKYALDCHGIDWVVDVAKFIENNPRGYRQPFDLYIDGKFRTHKGAEKYYGDELMSDMKELADYIEINRLPLLTIFTHMDPRYCYCVTPIELAHNFRADRYEEYGDDTEHKPIMGLFVGKAVYLYDRAKQKFSDERDIKKEMLRDLDYLLEIFKPTESTLDYGITTDYFILDEEERRDPKNLEYFYSDCIDDYSDFIRNDTIK